MNVSELLTKWSFQADHKPLDAIGEKLEKIQHRLEFLAAAEVVRGVFELTERFSQMGEKLNNAAMSAGITVESLQGLEFAASQAGVGAEEVEGSMARLGRQLYEARQGSEQAQQAFQALGISQEQVKGFHDSKEALEAIADRLEAMKDPVKKNALAMELLGRGGFKMVAFLSEGGKSMQELAKRAEEMGAVMAGPNVRALQEVEDGLSAMWQVLKTATATIVSYFAPGITAFSKAIINLYGANRKLIQSSFKEWAEKAMYAFGFVYGIVEGLILRFTDFAKAHPVLVKRAGELLLALMGLSLGAGAVQKFLSLAASAASFFGDGLALLGKPVGWFLQAAGWMVTAVGGLIARLGLLVVETFPAVGEALFALGTAVAANPFGLAAAGVVAAVTAITLALNALWVMMTGGKWEDTWVAKLWSGAKGAAGWIAETLGLSKPNANPTAANAPDGTPAFLDRDAASAINPRAAGVAPASLVARLDDRNQQVEDWMTQAPSPAQDPSSRMVPPVTQNTTVNAPITINVPPSADPKQMARAVQDGVREHLDRQNREVRRSLRDAVAY